MSNSSDHKGTTHGEFSVAISDANDSWEYTRRWVGAKESVEAFFHYCTSVGARMGFTTEVRLTDRGDDCNMQWRFEKGIIFPPEHAGRLKLSVELMTPQEDREFANNVLFPIQLLGVDCLTKANGYTMLTEWSRVKRMKREKDRGETTQLMKAEEKRKRKMERNQRD